MGDRRGGTEVLSNGHLSFYTGNEMNGVDVLVGVLVVVALAIVWFVPDPKYERPMRREPEIDSGLGKHPSQFDIFSL
jgi:hypothetical protein